MKVTHACGQSWSHADRRSHCTVCHRTFGGHTVGDAHRIGGECLTDIQMWARGYVRREKTASGITWLEWGGEDMPEGVHDRAVGA